MPAKSFQGAAEGGTYCHVYNRGIENRNIFADDADYLVFLDFLKDYLSTPKTPENTKKDFTINGRAYRGVPHQPKNYFNRVELLAYSLKPDHFHLLLHQKTQKSLQGLIRSLATRYSMYFNKKYSHTGSLFAGPYKSVIISGEQSLLLLTRYLHKDGGDSSYPEYSGTKQTPWVRTKVVLSAKFKEGNYKDFIEKYEPNQKELELLEKITIDAGQHLERRDLAKHNLQLWSRAPELLASCAVFVLLLGLGVRNITTAAKSPQNSSAILGAGTTSAARVSPSPIAAPAPPTPSPEPKIVLTVRYAAGPVNIREKPTTQSQKIGEAKDGDKFEFISENSGWYQVKLPDGQNGFINSQYIEKQEKGE